MTSTDTITALLLEDDADDYRLFAKNVCGRRNYFVVDRAENLQEAIQKLQRGRYDVVLTDLSVPDSQGLETLRRLKEHCPGTPIIVLTGMDDESVERDILAAGAQDYLVKGELGGRAVVRSILHAVQRQASVNEIHALVKESERSQDLLHEQARLLRKKNRRLKALYKTAQELVDNVSHDFRTPLTVIKDYVAIIAEGLAGAINDDQRAMLEKVNIRADDLNIMVDDLLDVSKLEAGLLGLWRRKVTVRTILEHLDSMFQQRAASKRITFTIECEPNLPAVYCDADKVSRVVTNLVINAIKFTSSPGHVRLWVESDPAGQQVVFGVTDDGPGIDEQSLEMIFGRFRQLDSDAKTPIKGFGLGLNIARQLCRLNLGEMSVRSQVGKGSTFSFTVPVAEPVEVMRRWLKLQPEERESLKAVSISIADEQDETAGDEMDRFLNYLLRRQDLLLHIGRCQWMLVMPIASSEADCWATRAKKEFQKVNRNRPLGPLPTYRVERQCEWPSHYSHETILTQFEAVVRQSCDTPMLIANIQGA